VPNLLPNKQSQINLKQTLSIVNEEDQQAQRLITGDSATLDSFVRENKKSNSSQQKEVKNTAKKQKMLIKAH
jgi:tRNA splicing ligase